MKKSILSFLLLCIAAQATATDEWTVHTTLLKKKSRKPCAKTTIVVRAAGQDRAFVTDERGQCTLQFVSCSGCGPAKADGGWIQIYGVRKPGDTALLKEFYHAPKSFKDVGDQEYRTVLRMPG